MNKLMNSLIYKLLFKHALIKHNDIIRRMLTSQDNTPISSPTEKKLQYCSMGGTNDKVIWL